MCVSACNSSPATPAVPEIILALLPRLPQQLLNPSANITDMLQSLPGSRRSTREAEAAAAAAGAGFGYRQLVRSLSNAGEYLARQSSLQEATKAKQQQQQQQEEEEQQEQRQAPSEAVQKPADVDAHAGMLGAAAEPAEQLSC
jgi:hypothetical protein